MAQPSKGARLKTLLAALDAAASDPQAWVEVCDALADLVDATGALLIPAAADDRGPALPHSERLGTAFERYIDDGWHRHDFRARGFPIALKQGFVTDLDLIRPEHMPKHPYYAELILPAGLKWFAAVPFRVRGKLWGAAVHRGPAEGPFTAAEIDTLRCMPEHLTLAARRSAMFGQHRLEALEGAFTAAERGVVAVGWSGKITWLNASGEARVRDFGLAKGGMLASSDAAIDQRLKGLVEQAIGHRPGLKLKPPNPVLVPGEGERLLSVDAIPMPRDFPAALSGAAALVTLHDVARPGRVMRGTARGRFGLTAREAELAGEIAAGRALAPAAETLGISVWTARQHLKSIFAKTGVHRQAELVALLSTLSELH